MSIPAFSADGLLPDGLHECTLDELADRFGRFQESDRRQSLVRQLRRYIDEVRSAGIGAYLVVDGSFATQVAQPNDIDLLLVLKDDADLSHDVPPFRSNPRSGSYVRKHYEFDFFFGFENDDTYRKITAWFRRVRYRPGEVKGFLKVLL